MAFPWAILAQQLDEYGTSKRAEIEQYNYMEGGFSDPKAVETGAIIGSFVDPTKVLTDPDVGGADKALHWAGLGWLSNLTGGAERYREAKEARFRGYQEKAHEILGRTPGYEIPKESKEMLAMSQEGAEKVRELSGEAVELAKEATGEEKMPGYDIIREDIMAGQAQAAQDVVQQKGVESFGNIAAIHAQTNDALKELATKNLMFRNRATSEYKEALGQRAQSEMAAVGLETKGLSEVARQKEQQYQIEVLDPHYNKMQWDIIQTGNQLMGGAVPESGGIGMEGFGAILGGILGGSGGDDGGGGGTLSYTGATPQKQSPLAKPG